MEYMDDNPGKVVIVGEVPAPEKESYWISSWKTCRQVKVVGKVPSVDEIKKMIA
jgi:hypothetical protein